MKKTKDKAGWQKHSIEDLMQQAMGLTAYDLLCAKITVRHVEKLLAEQNIKGEYNGTDIYEALQGIYDSVSAALSYILDPEEEEYAVARVKHEAGRGIWKAEACHE